MANVITYGVTLDASGAVNGFKRLDAAIDQSGKSLTAMEARAKALGTALGLSIPGGVATLGLALRKVVAESSEAQRVQSQLAAGLRSTGFASGQTVAALNLHAEALARVSTFSDEAIGSAQSILLTFTKLSGQTFPRATAALVDMATRMGGDLSGAAVQLGKALNDPVQGITALTRVGVSFTAAQKETIKTLTETNRLAEAQAMILSELETEFGGSAAAAANTLGGALTRLSNEWGNLFEVSQQSSGGVIRAINAIADNLPRLRTGLGFATDVLTGGAFSRLTRGGSADAGDTVAFNNAARDSTAALEAIGAARAAAAQAETERRAAFDEAKRNAAERERWETAAITRAVTLAQARFAAENPTGPGAPTFAANGITRPTFGGAGLPDAMRVKQGLSIAQARAKAEAEIALAAERELADERKLVTENYLRGVQGAFSTFFQRIATDGSKSFRGLFDSFKTLAVQTFAELAAQRLTRSLFDSLVGTSAGGGALSGLLGPVGIGIGVGALTLGAIFGGSRGPSYRANQTPRYEANGTDPRQVAAREWLSRNVATDAQVRQSVGGTLTESSASRIVGNLEAIRVGIFRLVALAESGAMGGPTVTVTPGATSTPGAAVAALVDRVMGGTTQRLRLASGAAVIG